jgi:putative transposase
VLKAYKYSISPTDEQKQQLAQFFGSYRFVYNLGLETKIRAWVTANKNLTCIDLCAQLKDLKDTEAKWLHESPAQSLQMAFRNLDNAYTRFFKGGGFPKFKNRHSKQSIQFPQSVFVDFENGWLILPKLKKIKCVFHRHFEGKIKTVTVSKTTTGKYFVSILVENQDELPKKKPVNTETSVGVDMGIKTFATLSDGSSFENPKFLRNSLKRLRIEQRKLTRRYNKSAKEQSKSYLKQKLIVGLLYEKIRNQRADYLHKASSKIISQFDTIILEDLNIKGMMSNRKLSKSVSDLGWHQFETMLKYKAEWYGKNLLYIGRFEPSSKLCSSCGNIFKELSLSDRIWTCQSCGTTHDRDANAAENIKTFGLRNKPSTVNVSH